MHFVKRIGFLFLFCFSLLSAQAQPGYIGNYSDTLNKARLWTVAGIEAGTYVAGVGFLSLIWYKDQERVPFHFYNDLAGYNQMDKWGHAYTAYQESYSAYYALRWAGLSKKKAMLYGGPIGLLFQTPIEIFDGLYDGWGFSMSDMGANAFGSALFMAQEAWLDEQVVLMKFSYSPSGYPKYHSTLGESELESFFKDYNGHTYWLSSNLNRLTGWDKMPEWLSIAVGYSGNGMIKEFDNPEFYRGQPFPHLERYRQYILSPDIDLSRIRSKKGWVNTILKYTNLIKVPFPAIEYNRVDGVVFHAIYY